MPHKRNPWRFEDTHPGSRALRGLRRHGARERRALAQRDISNSAVERIVFPDASQVLLHAASLRGVSSTSSCCIPSRMRENLSRRAGSSSAARCCCGCREGPHARRRLPIGAGSRDGHLGKGPTIPSPGARRSGDRRSAHKEEIEHAFDLDASLRNVDAIFFARTLGAKHDEGLGAVTREARRARSAGSQRSSAAGRIARLPRRARRAPGKALRDRAGRALTGPRPSACCSNSPRSCSRIRSSRTTGCVDRGTERGNRSSAGGSPLARRT